MCIRDYLLFIIHFILITGEAACDITHKLISRCEDK